MQNFDNFDKLTAPPCVTLASFIHLHQQISRPAREMYSKMYFNSPQRPKLLYPSLSLSAEVKLKLTAPPYVRPASFIHLNQEMSRSALDTSCWCSQTRVLQCSKHASLIRKSYNVAQKHYICHAQCKEIRCSNKHW